MKKSRSVNAALSLLLIMLFITSAVIPAAASSDNGGIKMDRPALELVVGETDKLTAKSSSDVTWSSSDEKIVTVDAEGNVRGIAVRLQALDCYQRLPQLSAP